DLPLLSGLLADPGDDAQVLVAHDVVAVGAELLVPLRARPPRSEPTQVAAADAAGFHLEQRRIVWDVVRHLKLADLELAGADVYRCETSFWHFPSVGRRECSTYSVIPNECEESVPRDHGFLVASLARNDNRVGSHPTL